MFDTMTLTKIVGGFCGALLVFLLANFAAEKIYYTEAHGEGEHQAYVIDTGAEEDKAAAAEEEGPNFAELYARADIAKGEKVFGKCKACHKLEKGANATGPYLYGVVGRKVDSAEGYAYSGALEKVVDVWTPENLFHFLENPKGFAPGTKMGFSGLKKPEDRVNLIAFLDQLDGDMTPVAAPAADHSGTDGADAEVTADHAAASQETTGETGTTGEAAAGEQPAAEQAAGEQPAAGQAVAEQPAAAGGFAALVAAADPADGAKVFRKCKSCHVADAKKNRVGPYLLGVVGRKQASAEGYNYSSALAALDGTWTVDELNAFLADPKAYAPGTKMSFPGLRKEADRAAVIAYLASQAN